MNTKEFIKRIQEADPSGEAIVQLDDGSPYYFIPKPSYYDGCIGELILDDKDKIIGFSNRRNSPEYKLVITGLNQESYIEHVIDEDIDGIPNITFDGIFQQDETISKINQIIARERKFYHDIHIKYLMEFCCKKLYNCSLNEKTQQYGGCGTRYDIKQFVIDNYKKLTNSQVVPNGHSWMEVYTKFWDENLVVECSSEESNLISRICVVTLKWKEQ